MSSVRPQTPPPYWIFGGYRPEKGFMKSRWIWGTLMPDGVRSHTAPKARMGTGSGGAGSTPAKGSAAAGWDRGYAEADDKYGWKPNPYRPEQRG